MQLNCFGAVSNTTCVFAVKYVFTDCDGVVPFCLSGLSDIPSVESKELAFELAQKWIQTNWAAYSTYEAMFEKVL